MKKTFRFFGMMLCIMLTAVCFSACDDDKDDDKDSSIVGTWKLTNAEDDYESIVTFKADGTIISIERDLDDGDEYRDTGKYTFDGEIVTIWWDDEYDDPDVYKVSVKGNRLTLHEDGYSIIYVRV